MITVTKRSRPAVSQVMYMTRISANMSIVSRLADVPVEVIRHTHFLRTFCISLKKAAIWPFAPIESMCALNASLFALARTFRLVNLFEYFSLSLYKVGWAVLADGVADRVALHGHVETVRILDGVSLRDCQQPLKIFPAGTRQHDVVCAEQAPELSAT